MNFHQILLLVIIAGCLGMLGLGMKQGLQNKPIIISAAVHNQANTNNNTASNGQNSYNPNNNGNIPSQNIGTTPLDKAHQFAFANGITSYTTIESFRPQEQLSREGAAKMFNQFAKAIYKDQYFKHINTFNECLFTDRDSIDKDLLRDVIESCYMGFMGGDNGVFAPKGSLTHEQANNIVTKISGKAGGVGSQLPITRGGLIEMMYDKYTITKN